MTPILELRGLRVRFDTGVYRKGQTIDALAGIDLAVEPGETLGLVGESGCGKTTLARCALCLQEPAGGTILFDGCELLKLPPAELRRRRREFQMVFQDALASLDPRMTIGDILAEPFEVHGLTSGSSLDAPIRELLDVVALDSGILARRPEELSGGQQQRVAIARALALKPRLLVADEPVSALDASVQAQILNLFGSLRRRFGLTLVLISHSLPVIEYLATRVAVMYLGRIVEEASAEEFFHAPLHPYSQALLDSVPAMNSRQDNAGPVLSGDMPSPASPPPGCAFHPRCPRAFSRCAGEAPPLRPCENGKVACFLYT